VGGNKNIRALYKTLNRCAGLIEISSRDDFIRAIKANKVVIVEYFDPDNENSKKFYLTIKDVERHVDPSILVARINIRKIPELSKGVHTLPCIRVFLDGEVVFEQQGVFGKRDLDLMVLRRGIRSVLRSRNVSLKI